MICGEQGWQLRKRTLIAGDLDRGEEEREKFSLIIGDRYSTIFTALFCASARSKAALVGEIAVPCTRNPLQRG